MLDFTAIDFETANSYRGSPCAVGIVRVRDGQPVDERSWLIRPPAKADFVEPFHTMLHGIDAEQVRDPRAGTWCCPPSWTTSETTWWSRTTRASTSA